MDDQVSNRDEITKLDQIAADFVVAVILCHFLVDFVATSSGALESGISPSDADVIVHQVLQFVSIYGIDYILIGIRERGVLH